MKRPLQLREALHCRPLLQHWALEQQPQGPEQEPEQEPVQVQTQGQRWRRASPWLLLSEQPALVPLWASAAGPSAPLCLLPVQAGAQALARRREWQAQAVQQAQAVVVWRAWVQPQGQFQVQAEYQLGGTATAPASTSQKMTMSQAVAAAAAARMQGKLQAAVTQAPLALTLAAPAVVQLATRALATTFWTPWTQTSWTASWQRQRPRLPLTRPLQLLARRVLRHSGQGPQRRPLLPLRLQLSLLTVAALLYQPLLVETTMTMTTAMTLAVMTMTMTTIGTLRTLRQSMMAMSRQSQSQSRSPMTSLRLVLVLVLELLQHLRRRRLNQQGRSAVASCSPQLGLVAASLLTALRLTELRILARHLLQVGQLQARLLRRAGCTSCRALSPSMPAQGRPCGCARCRQGTTTAAACAS